MAATANVQRMPERAYKPEASASQFLAASLTGHTMRMVAVTAETRPSDHLVMAELEWAARHGDADALAALEEFAPLV